jgi:hypothetical protein
MFARVGPSSFTRPLSPGRLMDVAESAHGMTAQPLHASSWSGESGASEAPKSTVRAVIWAMPVPEPVGEYATLIP